MKIHELYGLNPPRKPEKQSSAESLRRRQAEKANGKPVSGLAKSDQVEISPEAQKLQKSADEMSRARDLLSKAPQARSEVIYEALAKLKAGLYSSDEIVRGAAGKLLQSGELGDIV